MRFKRYPRARAREYPDNDISAYVLGKLWDANVIDTINVRQCLLGSPLKLMNKPGQPFIYNFSRVLDPAPDRPEVTLITDQTVFIVSISPTRG